MIDRRALLEEAARRALRLDGIHKGDGVRHLVVPEGGGVLRLEYLDHRPVDAVAGVLVRRAATAGEDVMVVELEFVDSNGVRRLVPVALWHCLLLG